MLISALILAACSKSYDVFFANPCPHSVEITTNSVPPKDFEKAPPDSVRTIPPGSMSLVEAAFTDALGKSWSFRVEDGEVISVDADSVVNSTIIIPSRVCNSS